MATELHKIIALEKTRKSQAKTTGDQLYHLLQKAQLANGLQGTYQPAEDEGEQFAPEYQKVQVEAERILAMLAKSQAPAWDITATKDKGNTVASANVTVDGQILLPAVPVTTLIFLEKQLTDLRTVISHAPILDPADNWTRDGETGLYRTAEVRTIRTKKVTEPFIVIQPTDKFPGQWTDRSKDIKAGTWSRVKLSGALPATRKEMLLERVVKLLEAVKVAREEANRTQTEFEEIASPVFDWLLAD